MRFTHDGLTFDVLHHGPASTGPASTGPASTGPASTGPASTGPASTGPASSGPASGETFVLLHGFPQDAESWDGVADRLAAAGYRVLVPRQRGYAPAARPRGRRAYRLGRLAADVEALLDQAGLKRVHLVGHDWGGAVAWAFAATRPHRLHTVSVVSTPHPRAMRAAAVTGGQAAKSAYFLFFQLPLLPEWTFRAAGGRRAVRSLVSSGLDEATARRYVAGLAAGPGAATGPLNWYRGLPFGGGPGGSTGPSPVPTLFVWGTGDRYLGRAAADRTGDHVTGPYTRRYLDASHWIPETRPVPLAEALVHHARAHPAA